MKIAAAVFHRTVHLGEAQLYPPDPKCLFCGSTNRTAFYTLQKDPDVLLLKCNHCFAESASRLPTEQAMKDYYSNYYNEDAVKETKDRVACYHTAQFGDYLARKVIKHFPPSDSFEVLDFGGGDGAIALRMAQRLLERSFKSITITVVDYNEYLAQSDDARIRLVNCPTLDQLPAKKFDFIIASAVIEHIPNPKPVIDRLSSLLNLKGVAYFRTPYIEPFLKLSKLLHITIDFTYPAHIHDLGADFWEGSMVRLLYPQEFSVLESNPSFVETTFKDNFLRTLAAYILKAPWYLIGNGYKWVGSWEIFYRKIG